MLEHRGFASRCMQNEFIVEMCRSLWPRQKTAKRVAMPYISRKIMMEQRYELVHLRHPHV